MLSLLNDENASVECVILAVKNAINSFHQFARIRCLSPNRLLMCWYARKITNEVWGILVRHGKLLKERRIKRRFKIEQDVRYKMLYGKRISEIGVGKSLNISSGGVWFTTENMLTTGMPVELFLAWFVLLNDSCFIKLMIYGCVIRSNEKGAAVAIERYEFRTQGSRGLQQASIQTTVECRL